MNFIFIFEIVLGWIKMNKNKNQIIGENKF